MKETPSNRVSSLSRSFRHSDRFPGPRFVLLGKLRNHNTSIGGDIAKDLRLAARWPVDLEQCDAVGFAQTDMLFQRVGSETAAGGNVPVDCQWVVASGDNFDPRSDRCPVGFRADQLDVQPVVPLAR